MCSGYNIERVMPQKEIVDGLKRFFPPPGEYHDQYKMDWTIETHMSRRKCHLCWNPRHDNTDCEKTCRVCRKKSHMGSVCPMLYVEKSWWADDYGYEVPSTVQLRPVASELAYLIIVGIFLYRPGMSKREPMVINKEHPLVKKFYRGKEWPQVIQNESTHPENTVAITRAAQEVFTVASKKPQATPSSVSATPRFIQLRPRLPRMNRQAHAGYRQGIYPRPVRTTAEEREALTEKVREIKERGRPFLEALDVCKTRLAEFTSTKEELDKILASLEEEPVNVREAARAIDDAIKEKEKEKLKIERTFLDATTVIKDDQ